MKLQILMPALLLATTGLLAQAERTPSPVQSLSFSWTEAAMPQALPNLVQIAASTKFFLSLEDYVKFSKEQRNQLQQIYFEDAAQLIQSSADFQLAASQLNALLAQPTVEMEPIQAAVRRKEAIRSKVDLAKIQHALEAVKLLTHQQHIAILLAVRDIVNRGPETPR
ncbi:MAG: hypothetical protein ACE5JX_04140 [Acidobacteriota bacterium]